MSIDPVTGLPRSTPSAHAASRPSTPTSVARVDRSQPQRDSVEISAEGRELAALDAGRAERLLVIQARIKQHFYSSPSVQHDVARRLLASGDL